MNATIPAILILSMIFFAISMQRQQSSGKGPEPGRIRVSIFTAIALGAIGAAYYFLRPLLH